MREAPCPSRSFKIQTGCGSIYVVVVRHHESRRPISIFANLGKAGGCAAAQTETTCRLVTLALENDADIQVVAKNLRGISCNNALYNCSSCSDAIAQAIEMDNEQENIDEAGDRV